MSGPALGVALPLDRSIGELVETAREAERLGYSFVWANDDRLQRDPFVVLAALAGATTRVRLGPGVTNPYSRHPALIASAIATLDELSGGRAVLGLGAGGTNHAMLGIERVAPAGTLREAVDVVRGLLRGEEVSVQGHVVRTRKANLDFRPARSDIPIYLGARGPRSLELAGEVADGVIVGNVATAEGWRYALEHIEAGATRAGRRPSDVRLVVWLYCSITDDAAAALEAVRPMVATSLVTSRPILRHLGVEMPPRFAELMEEAGWIPSKEAADRAAPAIPDEVVRRFALAGTPDACANRLGLLLDSIGPVEQVAIVPKPVPGQPTVEVLRRLVDELSVR